MKKVLLQYFDVYYLFVYECVKIFDKRKNNDGLVTDNK